MARTRPAWSGWYEAPLASQHKGHDRRGVGPEVVTELSSNQGKWTVEYCAANASVSRATWKDRS